ncbi:AEL_HP2_G0034020.mRNA.1.CDS.1 [Saccharomyces cerevisiae]|nr:AEL_HP2_G0034020.mRNA.1.CDS.1 [Saccharomyces cerevisiae]CAI6646871.1 AEL_HP2_G0034020.mRNA.1.CDS.1 [Saccharomyces cerevisiae]
MSEIILGKYLFERLSQVNCNTVFGLPGDFNLSLLDKLYEVKGMRWAGNANELNAAYAADGYARIKGMSCIITTFGVGELSALNGIAGSYAEHVGVLHVVGVPSISSQAKQLLLHHTLGNGDFTVFHRMSANISETTAMITDIANAPAEIDRCIRTTYTTQRPVYLGLPANLVDLNVPAKLLETPIDLSLKPNDAEAEAEVVRTVVELIKDAKNPVILADACASRHDVKAETKKLMDLTQFPVYVTPMGKGAIDEQHPRYGGVYVGTLSRPEVKKAVESADLILSIGALLSDFNTGSFSYSYKTKNIVEFHSDHIKIRNATFPGVQMKFALQKLLDAIPEVVKDYKPVAVPARVPITKSTPANTPMKQEWMWNQLGNFLREGDIVIAETGTFPLWVKPKNFPQKCFTHQLIFVWVGFFVRCFFCCFFCAGQREKKKKKKYFFFFFLWFFFY